MATTLPSRGFPRHARLTRRTEFDRVFGDGKRIGTRYFTLIAAPGAGAPRLGMAIGRRAAPRAVTRNRMKRLVREVFRHAELASWDVIVMLRPGAAETEKPVLRADLERGFEALK